MACASLTQAAELLRLDWDSVQRIMDRAVQRGLQGRSTEAVKQVGLDEKSFGRGQDYVSLMTDLVGLRVQEVVEDRTTEAAVALWDCLSEPQRGTGGGGQHGHGANFAAATPQAAPKAKIVHDRFHVSKHLNDAIDKVRREEHRRLLAKGDESLKHTKFLWLQGAAVDGDRALAFAELCERELKTAKAWAYKENVRRVLAAARRHRRPTLLQGLVSHSDRSRLEPLKRAARTLANHLVGLLNYFEHRITNAVTEGFNSRIQAIKAAARGFRRFQDYRTRILIFCGKLNLAPAMPSVVSH